jgi:hypothetical protein
VLAGSPDANTCASVKPLGGGWDRILAGGGSLRGGRGRKGRGGGEERVEAGWGGRGVVEERRL